jgi:hypothetical protein
MANRFYDQFQQTLVRGLVTAFIDVKFNGSGSPTLVDFNYSVANGTGTLATANSKGSKFGGLTFVRNGTGDYTLTLQDKFIRILQAGVTLIGSSNVAAPLWQIKVASNPNAAGATTSAGWTSTANNAVELLFFSAQGTAADPAATEFGVIGLQLMNSSAN